MGHFTIVSLYFIPSMYGAPQSIVEALWLQRPKSFHAIKLSSFFRPAVKGVFALLPRSMLRWQFVMEE